MPLTTGYSCTNLDHDQFAINACKSSALVVKLSFVGPTSQKT